MIAVVEFAASEAMGATFSSKPNAEPLVFIRSPQRRRTAVSLMCNLRENMENFPGFFFF